MEENENKKDPINKHTQILEGKWEELWSRVKETMKKKGLKPIDVSRGTGINPTTNNTYFTESTKNKRLPNAPNLLAMCIFLEIPIDPILFPDKAYEVAVNPSDIGKLTKEVQELKQMIGQLTQANENQTKVIATLTKKLFELGPSRTEEEK